VSDIFQYGSTSRELFLLKKIPSKEKITFSFSPVSSFFFFLSSFSPTQTKKEKEEEK
jgi:hypothetical protein